MELTILMPCLNEEKTIGACIIEARSYLNTQNFESEILIVDNGSTDNSVNIAKSLGARVVTCNETGYGNALRYGLEKSYGKYIVYADCDMSYNFKEAEIIYSELKSGADFVVGNRFHPFPSNASMSLSHQIGVPFLSLLGRIRYGVSVRDFHCGIRGITKSKVELLNLQSSGMEFATEIIAKAKKHGLSIKQVPVTLRPDGRGTPSHLRTVKDGFRHLTFMIRKV